jgi:hypothetical protein
MHHPIIPRRRKTMADIDYVKLQQLYGGRYIARRDAAVIASAETYDELSDYLDGISASWEQLVIEYVEPPSSLHVY